MLPLLYLYWDVDPTFFGFFSWYGLLFASSFAVGYWLMTRIFKHEGVDIFYLDSLTLYMGVSTVVGARLGHCFFYDPAYYLSHPLEIMMVWKGGLASHGAAIGIITGLVIWSRFVSKRSVWWVLDRIVIMVALSGLFIRTGNLMNSEILGDRTQSPMGVVFPRADQSDLFRARWKGEDVELTYAPLDSRSPYFSVFRIREDGNILEVKSPAQRTRLKPWDQEFYSQFQEPGDEKGSLPAYSWVDVNAGKEPKNYLAVARGVAVVDTLIQNDSSGAPLVLANHEFQRSQVRVSGRMEGGKCRMNMSFSGLNPGSTLPLLFVRQVDEGGLELVSRGTIGTADGRAEFDTLLILPPGAKSVRYSIFEKQSEILLTARHPGMMYEAFVYTLIFILLWLLYRSYHGKIPRGLFFGLFLVLVFGSRFLIEFLKIDQEAFSLGLPLNMGQLLSLPFVIYGLFRIVRSKQLGFIEEPPFPAVPESEKAKK
jgi:prolipoprotein diacylglyceryltransferase